MIFESILGDAINPSKTMRANDRQDILRATKGQTTDDSVQMTDEGKGWRSESGDQVYLAMNRTIPLRARRVEFPRPSSLLSRPFQPQNGLSKIIFTPSLW